MDTFQNLAAALSPANGISAVSAHHQMGMQLGRTMTPSLAPNFPAQSASDPVGNYGVDGSMRGRRPDGPEEKRMEQKQKRMIKNRESAAKSRFRKQAYTAELKAENAQLKEENSKLNMKLKKALEILPDYVQALETKVDDSTKVNSVRP